MTEAYIAELSASVAVIVGLFMQYAKTSINRPA